jgi:glycosyltransferase involved in cell wall biosynthesis
MRILHLVSYAVFSGPLPGVLALATAQRQAGHTTYVAHDAWRGNFSPYEEGAKDHPLAQTMLPPWPFTLSTKGGVWRGMGDVVTLQRIIKQGAIDVLHCHLSHDHILGALANPRHVTLVRTAHAERGLHPRLGSGWMWRRTHGVIVRSPPHRAMAQALGPAVVKTIAGAIDASLWQPPKGALASQSRIAFRKAYGIEQNAWVVGHVALMAHRGQKELLAAFGQLLKDCQRAKHAVLPHLVLVGLGPEEANLKRQAAAASLTGHVHFTGYLKEPALAQAYHAWDAAFNAQPGNDGAVRAALEAMAAGLPLIAVASEALADLINPECAFVVPQRSVPAIHSALTACYRDPAGAQRIGQRGQTKLGQRRSLKIEMAQTCQIYAEAAKLRRF